MCNPPYSNPQTPQNNLNAVEAPEQNDRLLKQGSSVLSDLSVTFFQDVEEAMDSAMHTTELVAIAQAHLDVFMIPSRRIAILEGVEIDGGRVLTEMLNNAELCGGNRALRYVAAAIRVSESPSELMSLAHTWVQFFLWPFKANTGVPSDTPSSDYATPTYNSTAPLLVSANQNRDQSFSGQVLRREGYRCALTKSWHRGHDPNTHAPRVRLQGAHILKRAVTLFRGHQRYGAPATWDIIKHYANLTDDELANMENLVDDPSNGMALELNQNANFDDYDYIFVKQEAANTYKCEKLVPGGAPYLASNIIVFMDHSGEGIPLPNPKFLGLHAAVGRILHLSGAGDAIDLVMDRYSRGGPKVPSSTKFRGPDDWSLIVHHLKSLEVATH